MKKVIRIDKLEDEKEDKGVEFTHYLRTDEGWKKTTDIPNLFKKLVYLGNCDEDGDMFAAYEGGYIKIYKGHLNNGTY